MNPARRAFLLSALFFAGATASGALTLSRQEVDASARKAIQAELDDELTGWFDHDKVPGVSVAIVTEDGSSWAATSGRASLDGEVGLTPEDRLLSGSVGKTYVSAAFLHLADSGKVGLDSRVAEFLGEEPWFDRLPNAREITLRQCLRHETGIPRYVFHPDLWKGLIADPDRVWEPAELLAFVFDAEPLFPAGEAWAYADTNYIVAGMVIESVTGVPYYDYVRKNLLEPNRLADTVPTDSRDVPGVIQGHVVVSRQFGLGERTLVEGRFAFNPQFEWCGGGFANTPTDLARWALLFFSGEAMEVPYVDDMLDAVPAPGLGRGMNYGLAAMISETDHGPLVGHDGFMPGYMTSIGYFPELGLAAAIQINCDDMASIGPLRPRLEALARIVVDHD